MPTAGLYLQILAVGVVLNVGTSEENGELFQSRTLPIAINIIANILSQDQRKMVKRSHS